MTSLFFWAQTVIVLAGMTVLFWIASSASVFGQFKWQAMQVTALLGLIPFMVVNSSAQRLRQTATNYPSIFDQQISPLPSVLPVTLASFFAASSSAAILPLLLSSLVAHPTFNTLIAAIVFALAMLPMLSKQKTAPSSQERSQ